MAGKRTQPTLWLLRALAAIYTGIGLWFAVFVSPRVPYADQYRFLANYLEQPFPANVLTPDNGHLEVLTGLLRYAELCWFDADQSLQITVGVALAFATGWLLLRVLATGRAATDATAAVVLAIGLFWLGNGRKLAHANEIVPLFAIVLLLVAALLAAGRSHRSTWLAGGMCVLATLTFGSGIATFAAAFAVLLMRRAASRHWFALFAILAATAGVLLLAGHGDEARHLDLAAAGRSLLVWLGTPFVWVLSPLLDAAHAARQPAPFDTIAGWIAGPVETLFGPRRTATWPAAGFGLLGLAWLAVLTIRIWRRGPAADPRIRFATGMAWFGFGVGALVAVARCSYFIVHREQVTAPRYVPWSMLLWTGLVLTWVLAEHRRPRTLVLVGGALALLFAPSQVWTGRRWLRQKTVANLTAAAVAVGVLDPDFDTVESTPDDLLRAAPLLRRHRKAMFAWPEVALLGETAPSTARPVAIDDVHVRSFANRFAAQGASAEAVGSEVRFAADDPAQRLLLLDAARRVRGLAVPVGPGRWSGWVAGTVPAAGVAAAHLQQ